MEWCLIKQAQCLHHMTHRYTEGQIYFYLILIKKSGPITVHNDNDTMNPTNPTNTEHTVVINLHDCGVLEKICRTRNKFWNKNSVHIIDNIMQHSHRVQTKNWDSGIKELDTHQVPWIYTYVRPLQSIQAVTLVSEQWLQEHLSTEGKFLRNVNLSILSLKISKI